MASLIPSCLCLCFLFPAHLFHPPFNIQPTAKPPACILTVLRVHLPLLLWIPDQPRSQSISSFVARASLFVYTTKTVTRMMAYLCRAARGSQVLLLPAPRSLARQPRHRDQDGRRARARSNTQACRACVSLIPILALSCLSLLVRAPPAAHRHTLLYVLWWCRVSRFLDLHTFAYAHFPPSGHPCKKIAQAVPAFAKGECVRFARNPRETKERDL